MAVIFFGVGSVLFVSFSERFSSKDDVVREFVYFGIGASA